MAFTRHTVSCPQGGCLDHLFTMTFSGTDLQDLGPGAHPAWSPDGLKLAFTDGTRVLVSNPDRSGQTTVLDWGQRVDDIAWAPDGQTLAAALFHCDDVECRTDIYRFNVDGSGIVDLTPDGFEERNPSWSPDGSKIAFDRLGRILTINAADGTAVTELTDGSANDSDPNWSPDGAKLAFTRVVTGRSDIYVMNADGSGQTNLTAAQTGFREAPAWAPNAVSIAYDGGSCQQIGFVDPSNGSVSDCRSHAPAGSIDLDPDWQPRFGDPQSGGYPRPRGATPLLTYLVPAYQQCTAPNSTHGAPLSFPSCAPPAQAPATLTVGTPDANGLAARSVSSVLLNVVPGNPSTLRNEADVQIKFGASDVRWAANLLPYNGEVSPRLSLRITDKDSSGATPAATLTDVPLSFIASCNDGNCHLDSTVNALVPGAVQEGLRSIWELDQVQLYDGGPDADAGTEPNSLFETQGVFVP